MEFQHGVSMRVMVLGCALVASASAVWAAFENVTEQAGVLFQHRRNPLVPPNNPSVLMGAGAAWLDYNNDGLHDLYATQGNGCNRLFRGSANGTFVDLAVELGVGDCDEASNGVVAADYDNDGFTDLFVTNFGQSRLFRNLGDRFEDVTASAGLLNASGPLASMSAAWGDYDRDGFVDLYVGNYVIDRSPGGETIVCQPNNLWRNRGDGRFEDVAVQLGVHLNGNDARPGCTLAVAFSDYDNDGDQDLLVVNDTGLDTRMPANVLFRNDRANGVFWRFTDVTVEARANYNIAGMGIAIGDIDNDGFFDYYQSSMGPNVLAHSQGDGTFLDIAAQAGVEAAEPELYGGVGLISWGNGFFDFDNDGRVDLFVVNGGDPPGISMFPDTMANEPSYMYRNLGGNLFQEVHRQEGLTDVQCSRGAAFADYDDDGDIDIYVGNVDGTNVLYRSGGGPNNWLKVRTRGTVSNRSAIGTRIKVITGNQVQIREVDGGSSFLSMNSFEQTFGLTRLARADRVLARFPSGIEYELRNVAANQRITFVEPQLVLSSALRSLTVQRGAAVTLPVSLRNYARVAKQTQSWWTAVTPAGVEGVLKGPGAPVTMLPGQEVSGVVTHSTPSTIDAGMYLFIVKVGIYPAVEHQYIFEIRITE